MEEMEARLRNIGREGSVQCETASREFPIVEKSRRAALWAVGVMLVAGLGVGAFLLFPSDQAHSEVEPKNEPPPVEDVKEPPEPPEPPKAETIEVLFESTPPGARIFTKEGDGPLGTTPVTLTLSRTDDVRIFELRLKGHRPARRRVSMAKDSNLKVELFKGKPGGKKKKKKKKATDIDMGGTVDPFED
jgi:hypothetical protein